jgi:hypothetical protein
MVDYMKLGKKIEKEEELNTTTMKAWSLCSLALYPY